MSDGKFEICGNNVAIDASGKFLMCCPTLVGCNLDIGGLGASHTFTMTFNTFTLSEQECISVWPIDCTGYVSSTWTSKAVPLTVVVANDEAEYGTASTAPTNPTQIIPGSLWTGYFTKDNSYYSRLYSIEHVNIKCQTGGDVKKRVDIFRYEAFHPTSTPPAPSMFTLAPGSPSAGASWFYDAAVKDWNGGVQRWESNPPSDPEYQYSTFQFGLTISSATWSWDMVVT